MTLPSFACQTPPSADTLLLPRGVHAGLANGIPLHFATCAEGHIVAAILLTPGLRETRIVARLAWLLAEHEALACRVPAATPAALVAAGEITRWHDVAVEGSSPSVRLSAPPLPPPAPRLALLP